MITSKKIVKYNTARKKTIRRYIAYFDKRDS